MWALARPHIFASASVIALMQPRAQAAAMSVAGAVRAHRRISRKQPPPAEYLLPPVAYQAIVDESWHELTVLDGEVHASSQTRRD